MTKTRERELVEDKKLAEIFRQVKKWRIVEMVVFAESDMMAYQTMAVAVKKKFKREVRPNSSVDDWKEIAGEPYDY